MCYLNKNYSLVKVQITIIALYIFLLLFYAFSGYIEHIPAYLYTMQCVFAIIYFCFLYYIFDNTLNISVLLLVVFFNVLFAAFTLRYCYFVFEGNPYGPGYEYNMSYDASKLSLHTESKSFGELLHILQHNAVWHSPDDWGLPVIFWLAFSIAKEEYISQCLLIVLMASAVTFTVYYLYKLMLEFNIKKNYALFFSAVYGLFPYTFIDVTMQGKNAVFCLFIVLSFYYMYRFKRKKRITTLIECLTCMFCSYFFRSITPMIMALSFLVLLMSNNKNRKTMILFILISFILGFLAMFSLFQVLFGYYGRTFVSLLQRFNERQLEKFGSGHFGWFIQILAALFGPFPNFNRTEYFMIMTNSGILYKMILSLPLWVGVWRLIKNFNYKYYPIIVYILLNSVVIAMYGKTLELRYQMPYFPLMLPVIAYTIQNWKWKLTYKIEAAGYPFFVLALIILYNMRASKQ